MYNPSLGRWMQRDPAGTQQSPPMARNVSSSGFTQPDPVGQYADGPNLYQYVRGNPVVFVDPYGLWSIVVDLPENRDLPGKLALYDDKLRLVMVAVPAKGQGNLLSRANRTSIPWWQIKGDTPTGIWTGELMGTTGDKVDTGEYGKGDRIVLTAVSGHAKEAVDRFKRSDFRIHGGRSQWLKEGTISFPTEWTRTEEDMPNPMPNPEDLEEGESYVASTTPGKVIHYRPVKRQEGKTQLPANTSGCIRLTPDHMRKLVDEINCLIKNGEAKQGRVAIKGTQAEAPRK